MNYLGVASVLITLAATTIDVLGRYLFNSPLAGATKVGEITMVAVVFFGVAYTQRMRGHVAIESVYTRLRSRRQGFVDLFSATLMAALAALLAWQGTEGTVTVWRAGEIIEILNIPLYVVKAMIPLGMLFLFMQAVGDMLGSLKKIAGQTESPEAGGFVSDVAKSED